MILFIGDGMGEVQVEAGAYFAGRRLSFENFPSEGRLATFSANSLVTDSAASATAMATGEKVGNRVLALRIPGNGEPLPTLLEIFQTKGKLTGLVTTTFITHATPAAFAAHEPDRELYEAIFQDFLETSPTLFLGGAGTESAVTSTGALAAGYAVVTTRDELLALPLETVKIWGQFGEGHMPYEADGLGNLPHLSEMTLAAISRLASGPDGFFLMVEGGRIDHAGHDNDEGRLVREVTEFSNAVQVAENWAAGRTDTLLLVTADHETGGLEVLLDKGAGNVPEVSWSTTGHTGDPVPLYAWGQNAELVSGTLDNTDVFKIAGGCAPAP
ncbi:MAG: alkaline phosphatase [Bdellovibrionota bacterium]